MTGPGFSPPGGGGGGGGGDFSFPARVDCSVNSAYVESPYASIPTLHTRSGGNPAGGYNGGGVGNKAILGFRVGAGLPLAALVSLEWTYLDLNPATPGLSTYANLILDVNGDGSAYKVGVSDPASLPALNNGTTIVNGDGSKTTTFTAATMNLLIVNGLHPVEPAAPVPPYVPPTVPGAAPPTYGFPAAWPGSSYSIASILAAFPACKLAEASSGDGGLPKAPNKTPPFLLITGDSGNQIIRAFRLLNVKFNGVTV